MEIIKVLSDDQIISLKTNLKAVQEVMTATSDNSWINDFFKETEPFKKTKYTMENFELDMSAEDPIMTDFNNAKLLHENLKHLPDSVLCDERLWVGLCFSKFNNYMKYRWNPEKMINLQTRWFIAHGQKRGLFFNGIARLFWFAKYTYDERLENPYEITEFCFNNVDILIQIVYRTYSNSKNIRMALFKAYKRFQEDGGSTGKKLLYNILKYVSFLGGAYILDAFTEEELQEKIYDKLIQLYVEENPKQTAFKL